MKLTASQKRKAITRSVRESAKKALQTLKKLDAGTLEKGTIFVERDVQYIIDGEGRQVRYLGDDFPLHKEEIVHHMTNVRAFDEDEVLYLFGKGKTYDLVKKDMLRKVGGLYWITRAAQLHYGLPTPVLPGSGATAAYLK